GTFASMRAESLPGRRANGITAGTNLSRELGGSPNRPAGPAESDSVATARIFRRIGRPRTANELLTTRRMSSVAPSASSVPSDGPDPSESRPPPAIRSRPVISRKRLLFSGLTIAVVAAIVWLLPTVPWIKAALAWMQALGPWG